MVINRNTVSIINKDILVTEIDDEIGMLNIEKGNYYTVNPVGKRIWELLDNEMQTSDIIGILLNEYEVEANECEQDVLEILNSMYENGLILVVN